MCVAIKTIWNQSNITLHHPSMLLQLRQISKSRPENLTKYITQYLEECLIIYASKHGMVRNAFPDKTFTGQHEAKTSVCLPLRSFYSPTVCWRGLPGMWQFLSHTLRICKSLQMVQGSWGETERASEWENGWVRVVNSSSGRSNQCCHNWIKFK